MLPVASADGQCPGSAFVLDFHPQAVVVDLGVDGEVTAGLARIAVKRGVRGEFGEAEDCVIGGRAAGQDGRQEPACLRDLVGPASVGARSGEHQDA